MKQYRDGTTDLAEQISDVLVVCALWEVGDIQRRLPCHMDCDLLIVDALLVFGEGSRNTVSFHELHSCDDIIGHDSDFNVTYRPAL